MDITDYSPSEQTIRQLNDALASFRSVQNVSVIEFFGLRPVTSSRSNVFATHVTIRNLIDLRDGGLVSRSVIEYVYQIRNMQPAAPQRQVHLITGTDMRYYRSIMRGGCLDTNYGRGGGRPVGQKYEGAHRFVFAELLRGESASCLGEFFLVDFHLRRIYIHCRQQSMIDAEEWSLRFWRNHDGFYRQDRAVAPGRFEYEVLDYPASPYEAALNMIWHLRAVLYRIPLQLCPDFGRFARLVQENILRQRLL